MRVGEEDDVVRPLPQELRVVDGAGIGSEDADRLVAHLPAVAVRAVQNVASPPLASPGMSGRSSGAGRQQEPSRPHRRPPASRSVKPARSRRLVFDDLDAVAVTSARAAEEIGRRNPVPRQESLHVCGGSVPRRSGVDDDDAAPARPRTSAALSPAAPPPTIGDVIRCCIHGSSVPAKLGDRKIRCCFWERPVASLAWGTPRRSRTCLPRSAPD